MREPSESLKEERTLLLLDTDEISGLKRMPYAIRSIRFFENKIQINISYSGGCKSHDFSLVVDRKGLSKLTKDANLILSHNDNGDRCKRIVNEKLVFDLSPLARLKDVKYLNKDLKLFIDDRSVEEFLEASN
jgi:hypothetical protein